MKRATRHAERHAILGMVIEILGATEFTLASGGAFLDGDEVVEEVPEGLDAIERLWRLICGGGALAVEQGDVDQICARVFDPGVHPLVHGLAARLLEALLAHRVPAAWVAVGGAFKAAIDQAGTDRHDHEVEQFCITADWFLNSAGHLISNVHRSWTCSRAWHEPPSNIRPPLQYLIVKFEQFAGLAAVAQNQAVANQVNELEVRVRHLELAASVMQP